MVIDVSRDTEVEVEPRESRRREVWESMRGVKAIVTLGGEERKLEGVKNIVSRVPKLDDWQTLTDEQQLKRIHDLLQFPLWAIWSARGDHRTQPLETDELRTPYLNLVMPWTEELCAHFGETVYRERVALGQMDKMIFEMGQAGYFDTNLPLADRGYLEFGSSTGCTPNLSQYYEGLKLLQQMREANSIDQLDLMSSQIKDSLREIYNLAPGVVIVTSPSGTEADFLPQAILGVEGMQIFSESGSATSKAAMAKNTSKVSWMGKQLLDGESIAGFPSQMEAKEVPLRESRDVLRSTSQNREEIEAWIKATREQNPQAKLAIHIVAGAKTGVGWERGGLSVNDAITLRSIYGGEGGEGIVIIADAAQNRLWGGEINKLLNHDIIVNLTGSKYPGGPMFSHAMLLPESIATRARKYCGEHKLPSGLADYLTQSDLAELLEVDQMESLPKLPNVVSTLKWGAILPTLKEYMAIERDIDQKTKLSLTAKDFRDTVFAMLGRFEPQTEPEVNVAEMFRHFLLGQEAEVVRDESARLQVIGLRGMPAYASSTGFDLLIPIGANGMNLQKAKKWHKMIAEGGGDKVAVHLGQAVEVVEEQAVLRITPPMVEVLNMMRGEASYILELCKGLTDEILRAMREVG